MTKRPRMPANGKPPTNPLAGHPAIWLAKSPTPEQLERMPGEWFHAAVDQLEHDTVNENYWRKVVAKGVH